MTGDGKARFINRGKDTTSSFPVLNQRALANTIGAMGIRLENKGLPKDQRTTENLSTILSEEEYQKLLSTEDFAKLYAQFLTEIPEYSPKGLLETRGIWIQYPQGSDPEPLVKSLEGHPLEWCTADLDTASVQLEGGDFYIYYSIDKQGRPVIPRLAIRMEEDIIAEPPRGIAPNQNLDPYITEVLEKKLEEFGDEGIAFKKRTADMKLLTDLEKKMQGKQNLNREELNFLYEIDSPIEGFGYERDPRIIELREQRNPKEDMMVIFGCKESEIAYDSLQVRTDTKAYIGPLEAGIFDTLRNVEHIYTSFPEGKIQRRSIEIGGKSAEQLQDELEQSSIIITPQAQEILESTDFTTQQDRQSLNTVRFKIQDLNLASEIPDINEIFEKIKELGLEPCPAETGPQLLIQYPNQPAEEVHIGMKPIAKTKGPRLFVLRNLGNADFLDSRPEIYPWYPHNMFVFTIPKKS
jgi:hypothetical protein